MKLFAFINLISAVDDSRYPTSQSPRNTVFTTPSNTRKSALLTPRMRKTGKRRRRRRRRRDPM